MLFIFGFKFIFEFRFELKFELKFEDVLEFFFVNDSKFTYGSDFAPVVVTFVY